MGRMKGGADAAPTSIPGLDLSQAQFKGEYVQQLQSQSAKAFKVASQSAGTGWALIKWILLPLLVIFGLLVLYDYLASKVFTNWPNIGLFDKYEAPPAEQNILFVDKAIYSNDKDSKDVTQYVAAMIESDTSLPSFTVGYAQLGLPAALAAGTTPNTLIISYHLCNDPPRTYTLTQTDGLATPSLPQVNDKCGAAAKPDKATAPTASQNPGFFSKLWNSVSGGHSGNLTSSFHDATTSSTIQAKNAPLSAERDGAYGIQWWMYVKDWNYGYGKEKAVLVRPDPTNKAVMNPSISLHPTDNALKISVSVYPSSDGGTGKAEPAPAGHSGATDDVFVCEVPNIPLQAWFAVGVTLFGRNLDVYIDGKLVKSCFIPTVPKPAAGDIQLTPDGGFSGNVCNLYHYPRMLTPGDAMNFWSAGTPCQNKTATGGSSATGYSVKFGVYDALGKEVQEYAF